MINTSSAYKNTLYNGHRNFIRKATLYLTDNSEVPITDADICQGGFKFDSATTSSGSFEIGNIIIEKFTIFLNNRDEKFSTYDFYNTTLWAYAGLILDDNSEEWFRKGVFTVKEPDFSDGVITLVCYDNIHKFDIPYANSKLTYPATRKQIVADICQVCGVTDNTGEFDGYNETVETRPEDKNLSCRDILSFIAQISGLYGRCDNTGGFKFAWYEKIKYEGNNSSSVANLDGGNFTDYSSGDTADGGNFTDYSSGDSYDGGILVRNSPDLKGNFHNVYSTTSSKPSTDDITITGIKVVTTTVQTVVTETKNTDPDTGEVTTETTSTEETVAFEAVSGTNEYMLVVTDNPLVNDGNAQSIADHLYSKIGGMTFRPMKLSALADPSMEAGDPMVFTDRKGNSYESYITTLSYTMGQYANMTCDAETPLSRKKNSETMSQALKNAIEMENAAERKYTRYAQAVDQLNQIAANALGFYETTDIASDGSKIVYMHDKPKLEESQTIYKRTIDGFFVSRDGGKTYTNGFDSNGNAVLNILSAIGINFDWAYGGTLTLGGDANGHGVLNIVDEEGNPIVVGNNNGLVIYKGSISFEEVTDSNGNTVEKRVTKITKNTVTTEYVDALEVTAKKVSTDWVYAGNIKASQIYGDTLTLGGNNNANGQLVIKDASGNAIVTGNKDGLVINKGSISWSNVTDTDNVASKDDVPDDEYITQITKNTITTSYIEALDITVKRLAAETGTIAGLAIESNRLIVKNGDNVTFSISNTGRIRSAGSSKIVNGDAEFYPLLNSMSGILEIKGNSTPDISDSTWAYGGFSMDPTMLEAVSGGTGSSKTIWLRIDNRYEEFSFGRGTTDTTWLDIVGKDYKTVKFKNGGLLYLDGTLHMGDSLNYTEKSIYFKCSGGTYQHDCKMYGGYGESKTGIGWWDVANSRAIWCYDDVNNLISSDAQLKISALTVTKDETNTSAVSSYSYVIPFLKLVVFHARFTAKALAADTAFTLGTISSSYAPTIAVPLTAYSNNHKVGSTCQIYVTSTGSIDYASINALDSGRYVYASGVWRYA